MDAIKGVWGVYRSCNAGVTWSRSNDDTHSFGGIGQLAGHWNTDGRIDANGTGCGLLYSNRSLGPSTQPAERHYLRPAGALLWVQIPPQAEYSERSPTA